MLRHGGEWSPLAACSPARRRTRHRHTADALPRLASPHHDVSAAVSSGLATGGVVVVDGAGERLKTRRHCGDDASIEVTRIRVVADADDSVIVACGFVTVVTDT